MTKHWETWSFCSHRNTTCALSTMSVISIGNTQCTFAVQLHQTNQFCIPTEALKSNIRAGYKKHQLHELQYGRQHSESPLGQSTTAKWFQFDHPHFQIPISKRDPFHQNHDRPWCTCTNDQGHHRSATPLLDCWAPSLLKPNLFVQNVSTCKIVES